MKRIDAKDWNDRHDDFKGWIDGVPYVTRRNRVTGATELTPVLIEGFGKDIVLDSAFLDRGSEEWERAWEELEDKYHLAVGYPALEPEPLTGETWQYMGSYRHPDNGRWFHEFRHRAPTGSYESRTYETVWAPKGWSPEASRDMAEKT